jgi:mono/diheme cytochrome c family protein
MPLIIKDYPDTNLLSFKKNTDVASLRKNVLHGGVGDQTNDMSPPWGDELSYIAVESVVQFLQLFYTNNDAAVNLLEKTRDSITTEPKINVGMVVFRSRCMICHGRSGNADGTMAKRLTIPPANLVKSRFEDDYLINIISKGGQAVSRSYQMPPWEGTLTKSEISSVVMYIKTLRE